MYIIYIYTCMWVCKYYIYVYNFHYTLQIYIYIYLASAQSPAVHLLVIWGAVSKRATWDDMVDGSEIKPSPPGMYENPVDNGINHQPQLVIAGFLPTENLELLPLFSNKLDLVFPYKDTTRNRFHCQGMEWMSIL